MTSDCYKIVFKACHLINKNFYYFMSQPIGLMSSICEIQQCTLNKAFSFKY